MRSLGRFFLLVVLAAVAGCGGRAAQNAGSFAPAVTTSVRPMAESTVKFYVFNGSSKSLLQRELSGYCIVTMAAREIKVGSTTEDVGVVPGCLTSATFNVRLAPPDVSGKSIYFATSFETSNGLWSQAQVRSVAIPYTGVCTNVDAEAAVLYIYDAVNGRCGGGGTSAKPHSSRLFVLELENRTGLNLVGKTVWSYCMKTALRGPLPPGTLDEDLETKGGSGACNEIADFLTYYYEPHSKALVAQIDWKFAAPQKTQLAVDAYKGYCAKTLPRDSVRFYKSGPNGCH